MQELGINSTAYETQSKKGTKRKCRSKEHDNGTGNDEIERDLSDDHDDVEYDPEMEEDKGEKQTDNAAPIQEEDEMVSAPQTQGGLQVHTTTSEIIKKLEKGTGIRVQVGEKSCRGAAMPSETGIIIVDAHTTTGPHKGYRIYPR
ncbi:hypothetical protein BVRB_6g146780 [Beta vulgaris subsp. vulgaris]|nr:hypothetical protein BVRB_6g146780 [Beta vulgaris subsp. vulgaris]